MEPCLVLGIVRYLIQSLLRNTFVLGHCMPEDGRERAVKSIRKNLAASLRIDYRRELAAITTFSKAKVDHNFLFGKYVYEFPRFPGQDRHCNYVEASALSYTSYELPLISIIILVFYPSKDNK